MVKFIITKKTISHEFYRFSVLITSPIFLMKKPRNKYLKFLYKLTLFVDSMKYTAFLFWTKVVNSEYKCIYGTHKRKPSNVINYFDHLSFFFTSLVFFLFIVLLYNVAAFSILQRLRDILKRCRNKEICCILLNHTTQRQILDNNYPK